MKVPGIDGVCALVYVTLKRACDARVVSTFWCWDELALSEADQIALCPSDFAVARCCISVCSP